MAEAIYQPAVAAAEELRGRVLVLLCAFRGLLITGKPWRWITVVTAVVAILFYSSTASAGGPLTWTLSGVTFSDGGTATGTFDLDASTQAMSNINISVSGGGVSFPPITYTSFLGLGILGYTFDIPASTRQLRITPVTPLTNTGGTVQIDLNTFGAGSGGIECFNCGPFRLITAGSLVAVPPSVGGTTSFLTDAGSSSGSVPLLAGVAIAVVAITAGGWYTRRRWLSHS